MVVQRRQVRVPASSANLGPGFDVLAVALALHLELEVVHTGRFEVVTELEVPRDRGNLVVRAFERLHPADEFEFRIASQIPMTGGLGSSAAAIVAGLLAASDLRQLDADLLGLATEVEGHPDNVAAALQGGIVICGGPRVHRFDPPVGLDAALVIPFEPVRTAQARAALPASVPLADAVFNVARAALLIRGLSGTDWGLIAAGLDDRLHQPWRAHLYPRSAELVAQATELGALGATISGAGPTVLVWCRHETTAAVIERLEARAAGWATVMRAPFAAGGAELRRL